MNSKQRKTLARIFTNPTSADLDWRDVVSLLLALGAEQVEGDGSRVRFFLKDQPLALHRPHPGREMKRYAVRELRDFLAQLGITP